MERLLRPAGLIALVFALVIMAVVLAGCGKSDQAAAPTAPGGPGAMPPGMGMPPPPGGVPAAPGGPPTMPGMPGMPGMPQSYPGAPGAAPAPTPAAAPARQGPPPAGAVALEKAPLKSPIQHVTLKSGDSSLQFVRFKYADSDGKVNICEMPASEAQVLRTPDEWLATFDLYKQEVETKTVVKKKTIERMNDFPFVSPPPSQQKTGEAAPGR